MAIVLENAQEPADPVGAAVAALVEAAAASEREITVPALRSLVGRAATAAALAEAEGTDHMGMVIRHNVLQSGAAYGAAKARAEADEHLRLAREAGDPKVEPGRTHWHNYEKAMDAAAQSHEGAQHHAMLAAHHARTLRGSQD